MQRRNVLKVLTGAGVAALGMPVFRSFAAPAAPSDEFFIFIHASGAWDVTVGLDPRNEEKGLIDPGSTGVIDEEALPLWQNDVAPLADGSFSFKLVRPAGNSPLVFGPGIGPLLLAKADRLTVINGIAMNTVSHPDGTAFASTGRHLAGSKAVASSVDTMIADSLGAEQLFPVISLNFPSFYVGQGLDARVVPQQVSTIGTMASSLKRSELYDTAAGRDAVTAVLSQEASDLAAMASDAEALRSFNLQYESLRRMNKESLAQVFTTAFLQGKYPALFAGNNAALATNAAFAVEMMSRNVVRCVSFAFGSFDTHTTNYRAQPATQQTLFNTIALLLDALDATPHPTKAGAKLADKTHILVVSDFCRTPQINVNSGRDHYPNGSALIVSPKFRSNFVYGKTDPEQLLPLPVGKFSDGMRAITPPDILSTFVSAFGADPKKYLRDGEVVKELLR